ncbi:hypothetical protein, partial [Methanosarcina mazei]|uniref:hypothetical protein n=1 Tax=Methanosarcina mazei TaxID=2209 RepID=UPI001F213D41
MPCGRQGLSCPNSEPGIQLSDLILKQYKWRIKMATEYALRMGDGKRIFLTKDKIMEELEAG